MPKGLIVPKIESYNYLKNNISNIALVWEYTRRNPEYIRAWNDHLMHIRHSDQISSIRTIGEKEAKAASRFGLLFFR